MDNSGYDFSRDFENDMKRKVVCDVAKWVVKGTEQKNPRLTLALADSTPLVYSSLDKKLLAIARLN